MEEEDDEENEFPLLTKEKKFDIKKFEAHLSKKCFYFGSLKKNIYPETMKLEEKVDMAIEVIKPKRYEVGPL